MPKKRNPFIDDDDDLGLSTLHIVMHPSIRDRLYSEQARVYHETGEKVPLKTIVRNLIVEHLPLPDSAAAVPKKKPVRRRISRRGAKSSTPLELAG